MTRRPDLSHIAPDMNDLRDRIDRYIDWRETDPRAQAQERQREDLGRDQERLSLRQEAQRVLDNDRDIEARDLARAIVLDSAGNLTHALEPLRKLRAALKKLEAKRR